MNPGIYRVVRSIVVYAGDDTIIDGVTCLPLGDTDADAALLDNATANHRVA